MSYLTELVNEFAKTRTDKLDITEYFVDFSIIKISTKNDCLIFKIKFELDATNKGCYMGNITNGIFLFKKNYKLDKEIVEFNPPDFKTLILNKNPDKFEYFEKEIIDLFHNKFIKRRLKSLENIIKDFNNAFKENLNSIVYEDEKNRFIVKFTFKDNIQSYSWKFKINITETNNIIEINDIEICSQQGVIYYNDFENISLMKIIPNLDETLKNIRKHLVLRKLFKKKENIY